MACDLHCHSKISDGSIGIEELIALARRRGLSALAITDHDAVAGATRACIVGKRLGLEVIHGVEMSAYDPARQRKVHILGYMCDSPDRLEGTCLKMINSRREAAKQMIMKVLRYYPIVPDSIMRHASGSTNVFQQHIMHALIEAGYADSLYGDVFKKLFAYPSGAAYVDVEYPDVREIIDLIHSAGGLVVMAHPYEYDSLELMEELTAEGLLNGIEVWHPSCDGDEERISYLKNFAESHNLLMTGGTDFHGIYTSPLRPLGSCSAPDETIRLMKEYKATYFK